MGGSPVLNRLGIANLCLRNFIVARKGAIVISHKTNVEITVAVYPQGQCPATEKVFAGLSYDNSYDNRGLAVYRRQVGSS